MAAASRWLSSPSPGGRARPCLGVLALWALVTAAAGCEGPAPAPGLPPGLEVVTGRVAAPAGGEAAVILRTDRAARVSLLTESDGAPLGAGRAEDEPSALAFVVPAWVTGGSSVPLTVVAMSTDGVADSATVTLVGIGEVSRHDVSGGPFIDVAAEGGAGLLLSAGSMVHLVTAAGGSLGHTAPPRRPIALEADRWAGTILVAGEGDEVWVYEPEGGLEPAESFSLPAYDAVPPQPVAQVRALHANGALVGAATDRGMSILDRAEVDGEGSYCRGRSAMTTMLAGTSYGEGMEAVVVTAAERIIVGGGYLNLNEPFEPGDDGTCDDPMPHRGTRVVDAPEGGGEPWGVTALALSGASLWIGRSEGGLLLLPADFEPEDNRRVPPDLVTSFAAADLPAPVVADLAPASEGAVWAVLQTPAGSSGGLALVGPEGVQLWVDMASLGGLPAAVDRTSGGQVWVATAAGFAVFSDSAGSP